MPDLARAAKPAAETASAGFGVYIHWPFCQSKCPYCDFNSHVVRDLDEAAFAAALSTELGHMRALSGPRAVDSVFFGGGTPSLMAPATIARLLDRVAALWPMAPTPEISLEANPSSVEAGRFAGYRAAGVNRVSLGLQALNDPDLKFLGRLHSAAEGLAALKVACAAFERVSADLIYARPGQKEADWRAELDIALDQGTEHLSLYQLTIEDETPFAALYRAGAFVLPDEEAAADLFLATADACAAAGLGAYEVSNFARAGAACRHNLVYWRYGDYVGAGPGAHGRLTCNGRKTATETIRAPKSWAATVGRDGHGLERQAPVAAAAQGEEMMLMGLRLTEGVSLARYEAISGRTIDAGALAALAGDRLVARDGDRLAATPAGRLVLDRVLAELLV